MTDESYSHKFMGALAESLGWKPDDVSKALTEIAELQAKPQVNANSYAPFKVDTAPTATLTGFSAGNNAQGGINALAVGAQASAKANGAVALGVRTSADYANSVAIGSGSTASGTFELAVGSDSIKRRVTHVDDPVDKYDAANRNWTDTYFSPIPHNAADGKYGVADGQKYGHVKIAHEVTNDSTEGVAVSPEAVYQFTPKATNTELTATSLIDDLHVAGCVYTGYVVYLSWYGAYQLSVDTTIIEFIVPDSVKVVTWPYYSDPRGQITIKQAGTTCRVSSANISGPCSYIIPVIAN